MDARVTWLTDFEIRPGHVLVKKTGVQVPVSGPILKEVSAWFEFFFAVKREQALPGPGFKIAFTPDPARPWYLIWPVVKLAGGEVVRDPAAADVVFNFDDSTRSPPVRIHHKSDARLINFGCLDVSKSVVANANQVAFGYTLAIDPLTHVGAAVEKSERNGAHDGRIVTCPTATRPGRSYQRVVNNRSRKGGLVEDLRTPTIGGRPACVFIKRRPMNERFANANVEVELRRPEEMFSAQEMDQIAAYTRAIGMDWGGLDILRDADDGRLYVVDANKTDMGPPTALPLAQKLEATRALARALQAFIGAPSSPPDLSRNATRT
jgi:hypothetical protein